MFHVKHIWIFLVLCPLFARSQAYFKLEDKNFTPQVPVEDIVTVSGTPLTAENFNVKYSIAYQNPIASSMEIPALAGSNLIINLHAVEYDTSTWLPLGDTGTYTSGVEVTTHLQITIVP